MMYGSLTSTLLRQMPSTICRSVRQTPAPPTRTITSIGREIFGSVTSSYLTNSFAVSFSSKAWSTAAFIYLSLPLGGFYIGGFLYFVVMAPAPPHQVSEQGLCQAHNKLIFLTFSAFRQFAALRIGPNLTALLFRDGTLQGRQQRIMRNFDF